MLKQVFVSLVLFSGTVAASFAEEPQRGGVINAVIQPEPPGLMLALVQNGPTQMVSGNIFEGLLRYSPKL
jgi:peptide/nickel transport system substrate-binding protein